MVFLSKYFVLLGIFSLKIVFYVRDPIQHKSGGAAGLVAGFGRQERMLHNATVWHTPGRERRLIVVPHL